MFIFYESNDFYVLRHVMLDVLKKQNLNNIFVGKLILIPNNNLAFFLKKYIAKKIGVCANFNFVLPAKFMWNILKYFFSNLFEEDYLDKKKLIWVIMTLLPNLLKLKEFEIIKNYLKEDNNFEKLYFLSIKIADLYDKYLVYRIDWLNNWNNFKENNFNNIHQKWQSILWRKILKYYKNKFGYFINRSNFYFEFKKLIKYKKYKFNKKLPSNIFMFNVSFLPPLYVDFFFSLSSFINIHYFLINPSHYYWYDKNYFYEFTNNIFIYKNNNKNKNKNVVFNKNLNLILFNCGKIFAEYLNIINFYDNFIEIKLFSVKKNENLLNKIQNDILYSKEFSFNLKKNKYLNNNEILKNDNSISINSCCGYLREIEILQDFIVNLILNYNYDVDDIVVIVSDLDIYYPYIKSVFSIYNSSKKYLPFNIMRKENTLNNDIFDVFNKLLNLPNIDFSYNEIMFFLTKKIILEKFNINFNDLEVIKNIISNVGIYSGIKDFSSFYDINNNDYCIWNNILKRILLGYSINDDFVVWNNIVPFVNIGDNFFNDILSKLTNFLYKLIFWKNILSKNYKFDFWLIICKDLFSDFFLEIYIEKCFFFNKNNWVKLSYSFSFGNFNKKINNILFNKIIIYFFKKCRNINKYYIGHLNFSSCVSLRSIPFKIICLVGMNNDVFPRNIYSHNFDLMSLYPRIGDRNKRENDKYIFLELLMSARKKFYISYINYSLIKNEKCYPSLLIDNLLDYINLYFFCKKQNINDVVFKNDFFLLHNKYVFDIKNFVFSKNYVSYQYEWLYKYNLNIINKKKLYKPIKKNNGLKIQNHISLKDVHLFWLNPIKYFFLRYLKINFYIKDFFVNKEEIFNLNIKNFYLIRFKLIYFFIKNKNINDKEIIYYLQSFNFLPNNFLGNIIWEKEKMKILYLINNIRDHIFNLKLIKFDFIVNKINIFGCIYLGKNIGVFKWLPKNLNLIDCFSFWIDHLIYCFLGGNNISYIYGYNGIWSLKPFSKIESRNLLIKYLFGYINGIYNPLFFFPKSSNMWILSSYNLKNKNILTNYNLLNIAKNKLFNVMYGDSYYNGELNDIYIVRLVSYLNKSINMFDVLKQAKIWLFPIFKYLLFYN